MRHCVLSTQEGCLTGSWQFHITLRDTLAYRMVESSAGPESARLAVEVYPAARNTPFPLLDVSCLGH